MVLCGGDVRAEVAAAVAVVVPVVCVVSSPY